MLADTLDQYRTNMAKNPSQAREEISDKIIFDMPVSVDAEFSSALRTVLVEASTASWEFWFVLLEQFKEAEGHCCVSKNYIRDGFKLGRWVSRQRETKDELSSKRMQRLNEMDFEWDPLTADWEEGFSNLLQFQKQNGHCNVPVRLVQNGYTLGNWVKTQRAARETMSPERKLRLDEIGFAFAPLNSDWKEGFSKLQQFKEKYGHCIVLKKHKVDDPSFGKWFDKQKRDKKRGSLSTEKLRMLNDIGFVWSVREANWEKGFIKLKKFKEINGSCLVPNGCQVDGYKLRNWVNRQRADRNMHPARRQRLDEIGFVWDASSNA